jgi:hypothetical protein
MRTSVLSTALVVALVGIACSDDTTAPATAFHATITGAQEVPATPAPSPGTGTATITIVGLKIRWTLNITHAGLSNYTNAHIHAGTATGGATNAGTGSGIVRVNLCGSGAPQACPTATGTVTDSITYTALTDTVLNSGGAAAHMTVEGLIAALRAFGAYVNVHTTGNGGGEIRGQVVPGAP